MHNILACIDPRGNTDAVIDWAAWAAKRLGAPLEFLHVLERHPERAAASDFSGAIGLGAQESLLQQLSDDDATLSRAQRQAGRELLAHARERAAAAGADADALDARLRHGDFVETALELGPAAGLLVLGEHHHGRTAGRPGSDHHLEAVVRGVPRPVLVATTDGFAAPERFVCAFDGSPAARRALATAARHPLLAGLPAQVVMVGDDTPAARRQLAQAAAIFDAAGVSAVTECVAGDVASVLPARVKALGPALLVMGAYGHSRLRQWLRGSTTTALLRGADVPVLVLH